MFENLVECAKNKQNNKKWMFLAATSMVWSLALAGAITSGIYFYDAHLDDQLRVISMLDPTPPPPPPPPAGREMKQVKITQTTNYTPDTMAVKTPPKEITTPAANEKKVAFIDTSGLRGNGTGDIIGTEGGVVGGVDGGVIGSNVIGSSKTVNVPPPPPPEVVAPEKPTIVRKSEGVIRGNAVTQVKPDYPAIARSANISGDVQIDITINENGEVINANVKSGHPMLQKAALNAVRLWKFNPTILNSTPVKVQGVITFRFTL